VDLRDTYNGFGDGLARAFEIAVTPIVFGAIGYGLDRLIGIVPILTIVFFVIALVGMFIRLWYEYDMKMKEHEAAAPWAARR
jgi:hypothetical protein